MSAAAIYAAIAADMSRHAMQLIDDTDFRHTLSSCHAIDAAYDLLRHCYIRCRYLLMFRCCFARLFSCAFAAYATSRLAAILRV